MDTQRKHNREFIELSYFSSMVGFVGRGLVSDGGGHVTLRARYSLLRLKDMIGSDIGIGACKVYITAYR